jgi:hypothetical protein
VYTKHNLVNKRWEMIHSWLRGEILHDVAMIGRSRFHIYVSSDDRGDNQSGDKITQPTPSAPQ